MVMAVLGVVMLAAMVLVWAIAVSGMIWILCSIVQTASADRRAEEELISGRRGYHPLGFASRLRRFIVGTDDRSGVACLHGALATETPLANAFVPVAVFSVVGLIVSLKYLTFIWLPALMLLMYVYHRKRTSLVLVGIQCFAAWFAALPIVTWIPVVFTTHLVAVLVFPKGYCCRSKFDGFGWRITTVVFINAMTGAFCVSVLSLFKMMPEGEFQSYTLMTLFGVWFSKNMLALALFFLASKFWRIVRRRLSE
jgi:hypothetical protein